MTNTSMQISPRWQKVIENIIWREDPKKGFDSLINVPGDRGGWTRAGISTPEAIRFFKFGSYDYLKQLTKEEIIEYYWSEHIVRPKFDILLEPLDELIVDFSVTSGSDDATKALQNALNSISFGKGFTKLKVDGVFGPVTRKELADFLYISALGQTRNTTRMYQFIREFTRFRVKHYINVLEDQRAKKPDLPIGSEQCQIKFMEGWFERAYSFLPKD